LCRLAFGGPGELGEFGFCAVHGLGVFGFSRLRLRLRRGKVASRKTLSDVAGFVASSRVGLRRSRPGVPPRTCCCKGSDGGNFRASLRRRRRAGRGGAAKGDATSPRHGDGMGCVRHVVSACGHWGRGANFPEKDGISRIRKKQTFPGARRCRNVPHRRRVPAVSGVLREGIERTRRSTRSSVASNCSGRYPAGGRGPWLEVRCRNGRGVS